MAFVNATIEIQIGNVESRLVGPVPRQKLDQALNPFLAPAVGEQEGVLPENALVYHPTRDIFLTGALGRVKQVLRRAGMRVRVRDLRACRRRTNDWRLRGYALRDYQQEVIESALVAGHGLIDLGTGAGKTLLAAAIIARLGLPSLYIVTTRVLLAQAIANLREYLGVEPGVIGQGVVRIERLTVALVQGLDPERVDLSRWRGGALVFDEGHHAAAGTWQNVVRRAGPRFHYYLSAVPFRPGADQAVLEALAGPRLTGGKYAARFLIDNGFACPVNVRIERCRITGAMREKPFGKLYREFIVQNDERNRKATDIALRESRAGRSVLVLVDHVRHGRELMRRLGERAVFVHGSTTKGALHRTTAGFARGEVGCLVATSGMFQEGVSIDGIHVLIQAGGLRSRAKVIQTVGRGMRRAPGKTSCTYVDFFDDDEAGVFREHSRERLRVLKEEGFFVPEVGSEPVVADEPEVEPAWAHVHGTRWFALVDGDGRILAKGVCLRKDPVPREICKRCRKENLCQEGGMITWRDDQG